MSRVPAAADYSNPAAEYPYTSVPPAKNFVGTDVQSFASKKIVAGIFGILLGGFGIHKFVLGLNTAGFIMLSVWLAGMVTGTCLLVPFLASAAMSVIGFVEGILYLTKSDEDFYQTYAIDRKEWF